MYYHVSYYKDQVMDTIGDSLLLPAKAKSDIEMLDRAIENAKKNGYGYITIYKGYMSKGERRWKTIVCRRKAE